MRGTRMRLPKNVKAMAESTVTHSTHRLHNLPPFRNFENDFVMYRSDNLRSNIRQSLRE